MKDQPVSKPLDVLAVIYSRRDRDGILDSEGLALDAARRFAVRNSVEAGVGELWDAVYAQAARMVSEAASLKKAGLVPMILRRTYLARVKGGAA